MRVYAAMRSAPDYTAPPPSLVSIHQSLFGAIEALYPGKNYTFRESPLRREWTGPDGFGLVREMEVLP